MKNYPSLKVLFCFSCLSFLIGFLFCLFSLPLPQEANLVQLLLLNSFISLLIFSFPMSLLAIWCSIYRYSRATFNALLIVSVCLSFCYGLVLALCYFGLNIFGTNWTFSYWLTVGGLEIHFVYAGVMGLFATLVLRLFLPKYLSE